MNSTANPPDSKSKECAPSKQKASSSLTPPDPDDEDGDNNGGDDRPKGVPKDWEKQPGRSKGHTKWVDPKNPHNYVRRKPNGDLVQMRGGRTLDHSGNEVSRDAEGAHGIRQEDFIFRE